MTELTQTPTVTATVAPPDPKEERTGLAAFLAPKTGIPVGLVAVAFVVGNILSPLYEHVLGPLIGSYLASRNDSDSTFIKEFNTGLSGPQAMNQPYLIAYFAREYKLAEDTSKSMQNRCSVAETIITYAQDPAIPDHASMLYAMPASVTDDVAYAQSWQQRPWYDHLLQHNPQCFLEIGTKIAQIRSQAVTNAGVPAPLAEKPAPAAPARPMHDRLPGVAAASFAAAPVKANALPSIAPAVLQVAQVNAAISPSPAADAEIDWNQGQTPGSVVGGQIVKIFVTPLSDGQLIHIRNTALAGGTGLPITVHIQCAQCSGDTALDPKISYLVHSVKNVHNTSADRTIFVPTTAPFAFAWHAEEVQPASS